MFKYPPTKQKKWRLTRGREYPLLARKKKRPRKAKKKPRLFLGEKTLRKCTYFFFAKKKMFSKKKKAKKKKRAKSGYSLGRGVH